MKKGKMSRNDGSRIAMTVFALVIISMFVSMVIIAVSVINSPMGFEAHCAYQGANDWPIIIESENEVVTIRNVPKDAECSIKVVAPLSRATRLLAEMD